MGQQRTGPLREPEDFFVALLRDFHEKARAEGWAPGGMIYVRELLPVGQRALLRLLHNQRLRQKFPDATVYYEQIAVAIFGCGVWLADHWQKNGAAPTEEDLSLFDGEGDWSKTAAKILSLTDSDELMVFLRRLSAAWLEEMTPYWRLPNGRDYVFQGLLVFCLLGISQRLTKMGVS